MRIRICGLQALTKNKKSLISVGSQDMIKASVKLAFLMLNLQLFFLEPAEKRNDQRNGRKHNKNRGLCVRAHILLVQYIAQHAPCDGGEQCIYDGRSPVVKRAAGNNARKDKQEMEYIAST